VLSAIAFGLGHGAWWLPGTAAGLAYGLVVMRTGRIGEGIAAHATTNGLIAAWVLLLQQWQLWYCVNRDPAHNFFPVCLT
jgi:uncharacterized protein